MPYARTKTGAITVRKELQLSLFGINVITYIENSEVTGDLAEVTGDSTRVQQGYGLAYKNQQHFSTPAITD